MRVLFIVLACAYATNVVAMDGKKNEKEQQTKDMYYNPSRTFMRDPFEPYFQSARPERVNLFRVPRDEDEKGKDYTTTKK